MPVLPARQGRQWEINLLAVLQEILGDYARQAAPELLTHKSRDRHPTELADLFGARLVTSVEVDEGKRLAETLVKQMTGGDRMKARFMRGDFFEWTPTHKLFLAANHRPVIRGTDYAIWRRIHLVPFEVTIPKEERDPQLPTKLLAEASGILAWAVRGCLEWQRGGLGVPKAVEDATAAYRAEQDVLADFLTECCILDPQASVTAKGLWDAWKSWCEQSGEREGTQRGLGLRLAERGFEQARGAKGVRSWRGLRLLGPDEGPSGDTYPSGDAERRGFPYENASHPHEEDIWKTASQASLGAQASPDDDRDTACWRCKRPLSTASEYPCEACGWLRCDCGACSEGCADHVEEDL
jgi:putative DNA primase/helicase